MRFISNSKELVETFKSLARQYSHYKWAVAWAGKEQGFDIASVLDKNISKMERMVVGLHFYQTDPDFIEHHMSYDSIRFIMKTDGIFHSKVYLFYDDENEWSAIVGSSNFTFQGFHKNSEANILIQGAEASPSLYKEISLYIDGLWKEAAPFSANDLKRYRELCSYQKSNLNSLSKPVVKENFKGIYYGKIDVMTWDSFVSGIGKNGKDINQRMDILDKAHELFECHRHFSDIPAVQRKCLAGFQSTMPGFEGDWKFFGSMQGAGRFKSAINKSSEISRAIDLIPMEGDITEKTFEQYCEVFFEKLGDNPLACATRLLAMKRPDWFICVDSKNRKNLCKQFGISSSSLTLESYWDSVVMRVRESEWFNEKGDGHKMSDFERRLKKYQVAMLDSLYYEG